MTNNKMTQVQALTIAAEAVEDKEVREILLGMITTKQGQAARAKARKASGTGKKDAEKVELRNAMLDAISEGVNTTKALAEKFEVSTQKVAGILKAAVDAGTLTKEVVKTKEGEKSAKATIYKVVE